MGDLVKNIEEIIQNIETFNEYAYGTSEEKSFFLDKNKQGKNFIAYREQDGYKFCYSKFVGYKENSNTDSLDSRHGGVTSKKISRILGEPYVEGSQYNKIDKVYEDYCINHDIKSNNRKRKYWIIGSENITIAELPPERNAPRFSFVAGCSPKPSSTTASVNQSHKDMILKHNDIQEALYNLLVNEHGEENVGTENRNGIEGYIDVVLRKTEVIYWFYEIKTAETVRYCIREALGQLLEYSYYPKTQKAERLIIVGEASLDKDGEEYLNYLRKEFNLPLYYQSVTV